MYKCKKCGYKTSFKMLMVNHIKSHNRDKYKTDSDTVIDPFILAELTDSFSTSSFSESESFSGGGGSFGGGGASGGWDSDSGSSSCDSGSCGGD